VRSIFPPNNEILVIYVLVKMILRKSQGISACHSEWNEESCPALANRFLTAFGMTAPAIAFVQRLFD
jgi:hypothetical protein